MYNIVRKGVMKMVEVNVGFRQAEDIVHFVETVQQFPCHADLVSGNRAVDAKSLMGAFAISQASDLRLVIYESSQKVINEMLSGLQDFTFSDKKKTCVPFA